MMEEVPVRRDESNGRLIVSAPSARPSPPCISKFLSRNLCRRRPLPNNRQENRVSIVTTYGDSGIAAGMGGTGSRM